MNDNLPNKAEVYLKCLEMKQIGNYAVRKAQERNRQKGIPNVYLYNGILYYELPNGELSKENPFNKRKP